ncbi:hypothetical protein ACFE04_000251 [Oxalis oulophora]
MIEIDHDLSDDADYAASLLQQPAAAAETETVYYVKDNVTIHPTQFASERISGRLKLTKQSSTTTLFLTWIPYKGQSSNPRLSEKGYSSHFMNYELLKVSAGAGAGAGAGVDVPLTDVRSIRRHTPALGWQYVIVVLASGLAYPPFYFYNGGVREFLATIKQHTFLVRSAEDANVFLVNDFQSPLQKTLSSLELPMGSIASGHSPTVSASQSLSTLENQARTDDSTQDVSPSISQYNGRPNRQKSQDISIQVLEKFSLVTKFARDTTSQIFRENNGFDRKNRSQSDLDYLEKTSIDEEKVTDLHPVPADPLETIAYRKDGFGEEADTNVGTFELISCKEFDKQSLVWGKPRQPPLGFKEWATFLDSEGRVKDSNALRKRIFYGGVDHELRKEVWSILLGYYAYDSTYAERQYLRSTKKTEYETIKSQWKSILPEQAKRFTKFRERKGLIDKDVVRTDRSLSFYDGDDNPNVILLRDILLTYSFYNFDLGYCQGMSDFLSPILFVMEDESESFWCFVALMERLGPNFNRDQNGMHSQLFALSKLVELLDSPLHNYFKQNDCLNYFFCFRWVLIQFKREFEYDKTMRMWEVLWTHYLSEHMHLYICVAILKRYRNKIIGEQMDFDYLLKFINEMSGHIDLDSAIRDGEALCICAGENGAARIPPGTPPSLPIDSGSLYPQQDDDVL